MVTAQAMGQVSTLSKMVSIQNEICTEEMGTNLIYPQTIAGKFFIQWLNDTSEWKFSHVLLKMSVLKT